MERQEGRPCSLRAQEIAYSAIELLGLLHIHNMTRPRNDPLLDPSYSALHQPSLIEYIWYMPVSHDEEGRDVNLRESLGRWRTHERVTPK